MTQEELQQRIAALRDVCGEAYQVLGAVGAPARVLDQLWAAVQGDPLPHASVLPVLLDEVEEVAKLRRLHEDVCTLLAPSVYQQLGRRAGRTTSPQKTRASRANGRKGGRPRKLAQEESR